MKLPTMLLLLFLLVFSGCGGGSGDRDPTVITGNVLSAGPTAARPGTGGFWRLVTRWLRPEAVAQVPGITVSIDNSSGSDITDDNGVFRIEGNHFGEAILRFTGNGADGTLAVLFPAGGVLELANVRVTGTDVDVEEQRIATRGPITGADCPASLLQLLSGERVAFRVRLTSETLIRDEDGQALFCSELGIGREVEVLGVMQNLDTIVATEIQANPSRVTPTAEPTVTRTASPTSSANQTGSTTRTPTPRPTHTPEPTVTSSLD